MASILVLMAAILAVWIGLDVTKRSNASPILKISVAPILLVVIGIIAAIVCKDYLAAFAFLSCEVGLLTSAMCIQVIDDRYDVQGIGIIIYPFIWVLLLVALAGTVVFLIGLARAIDFCATHWL